MIWDYAENIIQLLANMTALLICLFQHISDKKRAWVYAAAFFFFNLFSCYYWSVYYLIKGFISESSDLITYAGWNIAFFILLIFMIHIKSPEERRFFHPLMLLPIPLNIWQLSLYLSFSISFNSIYQVTVLTIVVMLCIQSICWTKKNGGAGRETALVAIGALLYATFEFGMWTASCFDAPISNLYYPFSFLSSLSSLYMAWALRIKYRADREKAYADWRPGEKLKGSSLSLLIPVLAIFFLMTSMVIYTSRTIRSVAVTNIHEVGEDRISGVASQLENYLEMTKSTLWVTSDTVDHMIHSGETTEEILDYMTEESANQEEQFDENYTGIYGYVMGEYLDGDGWVPSEGFDPLERDWYQAAIKAGGEATIVPPYVDAQTGSVIISISRMLSNGTDVLSLDVMMNHIQDMVADLQIKGKGYGFVVDGDGLIIAHRDDSRKGKKLNETEEQKDLLKSILDVKDGDFETEADGEKSTAFVHGLMDQWYVVIIISNRELYSEVWKQLAVNVLACTFIFVLIAFFYVLGYRNEQTYSHRIEVMRAEEQKKEYEARALILEKEAADNANKAKSDFLAEMSHEIRTPIHAVLGMNEMILKETGSALDAEDAIEDSRETFDNINVYAKNIDRAGNNLLSIINDILDFSKIEAGKIEITEKDYRLSTLLSDVSSMMFFKARDKGLDYIVDVDEDLPDQLRGDDLRVRQVMINILNNAIKYTGSGSVSLDISSASDGKIEAGQVFDLVVSVRDTGIGIKEEDIGKLFSKFQRVDLDNNSTVEGTGLGLAITQSLLELMGGSIDVESEYGSGSTFTMTIPQKAISAEPVGDFREKFEASLHERKVYEGSFTAPDARILVVDDTPMNLTVVTGLLKNTDIQIDTAESGEEAVWLATENAYDLIMMDQRMPKMDGTETLRRIRAAEGGRNPETPVICLTADALIGAKNRYVDAGFTDYLAKPVDSKVLEKMLLRHLPEEKVTMTYTDGQTGADAAEPLPSDGFDALRLAGVDPGTGLQYCGGDAALLRTLLAEFAGSGEERAREIRRLCDEEDWKNYSVIVHSVKSSSKMIGAAVLSDMAAGLEKAADAGEGGAIHAGNAALLYQLRTVCDAIRRELPEAADAADRADDEEDMILEFMPEEDS